jgi:hypothetical protein
MAELDLKRIERLWGEATDADILAVLTNREDVPAEVYAIITAEAEKRGLEFNAPGSASAVEGDGVTGALRGCYRRLRPIAGAMGRFVQAHRFIFAGLFALSLRQCNLWIPWPAAWPWFGISVAVFYVVFLAGLAAICWPLRRYPAVAGVTLVAHGCLTVVNFPDLVTWFQGSLLRKLLITLLSFAAIWLISCTVLSAVVFLRNRYRPIYPAGLCTVCGYDLRGLSEPRCPECGSAFDPRELARGVQPQNGKRNASSCP